MEDFTFMEEKNIKAFDFSIQIIKITRRHIIYIWIYKSYPVHCIDYIIFLDYTWYIALRLRYNKFMMLT